MIVFPIAKIIEYFEYCSRAFLSFCLMNQLFLVAMKILAILNLYFWICYKFNGKSSSS